MKDENDIRVEVDESNVRFCGGQGRGKGRDEGCKSRLDTFTRARTMLSWERATSCLPTLLCYVCIRFSTWSRTPKCAH